MNSGISYSAEGKRNCEFRHLLFTWVISGSLTQKVGGGRVVAVGWWWCGGARGCAVVVWRDESWKRRREKGG